MPCLIFVVVFIISYYISHIGVDPHHDGLMLKNALDVYSGKMLFKESYTPYGALTTLIHSWFMLLFGAKLISLKIASSLFYALSGVLIWLISRHFLSKKYSLILILLWIGNLPFFSDLFYPWASIYATFFVLLTQYLVLCALSLKKSQRFKKVQYVLSGASALCAFWCKQPYSLVFFALILIPFINWYVKKDSFKKYLTEVLLIVLGGAAVTGMFLVWLIFNNSLYDWFIETVRLGYITGRVLGEHFSIFDFFSVLFHNPLGLLVPLSVLSLSFMEGKNIILGKKKKVDIKKISLFLLGLSALLSYYPLYDQSHRFWAGTPSYVVVGIILFELISRRKASKGVSKYIYPATILLLTLSMVFDTTRNTVSLISKIAKPYSTISYPLVLSGIKEEKVTAESYRSLARKMDEYFSVHKSAGFVVLGSDALSLTFTSHSHNTGPYFVDFSNITSGIYPYNDQLDRYISSSHPLVLITKVPPVVPPKYQKIGEYPSFHSVLVAPNK